MLPKDIFIYETTSAKDALKKLDRTAEKILLVIDREEKLLGTLSDGDIRRYILKGKSLEDSIEKAYNRKPIYLRKDEFTIDKSKGLLLKNKIELLPVLDEDDKVIDFAIWSEVFSEGEVPVSRRSEINIPVVIMAGGKGTRLEPFSRIFPKPLIPIGDRAIIDIIIDGFKKQGVYKFYLTLNHKREMVESYLNSIEKDYEIKFIKEEESLGTAGGLKLLEEEIDNIFIVSNCDVIVKANFEEVINFHKKRNALLTILSSIQHYKIPYGVIKFGDGGGVEAILEKPEYTFPINTGVYILNREVLELIPKKSYFEMTDLVKTLIENNKKVITYPVNENDYIDIGEWEQYKKALNKLEYLK